MTTIHARGPVSVAEFEALPDDGNRYELLDGTVYVTPAPAWAHQVAMTRLAVVLAAAAPPDVEVVAAAGYQPSPGSVLVPDLVVARHPARGQK